ncbi:oligosaccharide flippase family protein [Escherichia coli]|nr:oligosaccharide flippase family protein [Escherichia coli]
MKKKKAASHLIILTVGTLLTAFLNFATQIILARHMIPSDFGSFSSAFYLVMTLAPLCGFGIPQFWLKVFGSEGWAGTRFIVPSLIFTAITTSLIIMLLSGWFYYTEYNKHEFLYLLSFVVLSQVIIELLGAVYQLEENYIAVSLIQLSVISLRFISLIFLFLIFKHLTTDSVSLIYALDSLIIIIFTYGVFRRIIKKEIKLKGHIKNDNIQSLTINIKDMIKESAVFGIAGVFYMIYFQVNIILVKYFISPIDAGYYSVAFLFISAAILLPTVTYQKYLLPKLHRWAYQDLKKLKNVYKYGNISMFLFGVVVSILIWFLCPMIVSSLFGEKYMSSIKLIRFLSLSIPIIYLASNSGAILVTKNNMQAKVKIMFVASFISLLVFFVTFRNMGVYAGVLATILSNLFICIAYNYKSIVFFRGE